VTEEVAEVRDLARIMRCWPEQRTPAWRRLLFRELATIPPAPSTLLATARALERYADLLERAEVREKGDE
jgi:hypothetical protein